MANCSLLALVVLAPPFQARFSLPASQSPNAGTVMLAVVLLFLSVILHLLPSALAMHLKHPAMGGIIVVNVFFGWSLLGWVVALAWAPNGDHRKRRGHSKHYHGYSPPRRTPDRYGAPDFSNMEDRDGRLPTGRPRLPEDNLHSEQTPKKFQFLILDQREEIPINRWYRMSHWKSENFLVMQTGQHTDWKIFSDEEQVVGVTHEDRQRKFLVIGDRPDFRVVLQRDPSNPYDRNAIEVLGSATVNGAAYMEQLGFLAKETAERLRDKGDLAARPHSVWLPYGDCGFGLRIRVFVRSVAYKKRIAMKETLD